MVIFTMIQQSMSNQIPKQPIWTGSRDDVVALLKEVGLL